MADFYMLIGIPASGKSWWAKNNQKDKFLILLAALQQIPDQALDMNFLVSVLTLTLSPTSRYSGI